jgi:hypothetical protein
MSANYLRTLESTGSLQPSRVGMWNLAAALDCPIEALTGSGMESPPGRPQPSGRQHIETLTSDECAALVAPGGIGRFIFLDERGPVAWPVNFRILDGDVVFRTEGRLLSAQTPDASRQLLRGGSAGRGPDRRVGVLMTGKSRLIDDLTEQGLVESLGVQPWATGPHDAFVRLYPRTITGRRIRRDYVQG